MIVFGICSSISVKSEPKSVFSDQQRFEQTKDTINSIRNKIANSYVVLCENTNISAEHRREIENLVDVFISISENVNEKSRNEARQCLAIIENIKNINYESFFKLSGRYTLNEKFNLVNYKNDKINFRRFDRNNDSWHITVLYSFNKNHETYMKNSYVKFIEDNLPREDIEHGMCRIVKENLNRVSELGVSGHISPTGEFTSL